MSIFISLIQKPAIIIAMITLIGLIAQKQSIGKVIRGSILTFLGFSLFSFGAATIAQTLGPFSGLFSVAFKIKGIVASPEAMMAAEMVRFGTTASLILLLGLVANVLIARFSPFKTIYLAPQLALYMAFALAAVLAALSFNQVLSILIGGLVLGCYMALSPSLLKPQVRAALGTDDYTTANTGTPLFLLSAWIGSHFGNKKHDAEHYQISERFELVNDPTVVTAIVMFVLFFLPTLFAKGPGIEQFLAGQSGFIYALDHASQFTIGLIIVKFGISMFVDELIPAFKGFARLFAPGAIPGVDALMLVKLYPNTALLGFLIASSVSVLMMLIFPAFHLAAVAPEFIACFMIGGATAIIANQKGGVSAAILSSALTGFLLSFLPAISLPLFEIVNAHGATFSDPDMILVPGLIWLLLRWF